MSLFADPKLERIYAESFNERVRRPFFFVSALSAVFGSVFLIVLNVLSLSKTDEVARANALSAGLSIGGGLSIVALPFFRSRFLTRYFDGIMAILVACNFVVHVLPFAVLAPDERRPLGWLAQVTIMFATLLGFRLPGVYVSVAAILVCYYYAVAVQHEAPLTRLAICGGVALSTPLALRMAYITDGSVRGNFREVAERIVQLSELARPPQRAERGRSASVASLGSIRVSAALSADRDRAPGSTLHRAFELPHDLLDAVPSSPPCGPAPPSPGVAGAGCAPPSPGAARADAGGGPPALSLPPPALVVSLDGPPEERGPRPPSRAPSVAVASPAPPSPEPRRAWATPRGSPPLAAAAAAVEAADEGPEAGETEAPGGETLAARLVAAMPSVEAGRAGDLWHAEPLATRSRLDRRFRDPAAERAFQVFRMRRAYRASLARTFGVGGALFVLVFMPLSDLAAYRFVVSRDLVRSILVRVGFGGLCLGAPLLLGFLIRWRRHRREGRADPLWSHFILSAIVSLQIATLVASILTPPDAHALRLKYENEIGLMYLSAILPGLYSLQFACYGALPVLFAFGGYAIAGHSLLGPLNILSMYLPLLSGLLIMEGGMRFMFAVRVYRYKQVVAAQRLPEGEFEGDGPAAPSAPSSRALFAALP